MGDDVVGVDRRMPVPAWREPTAQPLLTAKLLGRVSLAVGGQRIADAAWPPRGGRELLLLLLIAPQQRLTRDRILETLWPDLAPHAARNALYKAVHSVRRTLEPTLAAREEGRYLRGDAASLALRPGSCVTDVTRFERLLAAAEAAPTSERQTLWQKAVALYRGDLLAEALHLGWASERREQLRLAWLRAMLHLVALDLDGRQWGGAIDRLSLILARDPSSETAHRLLMQAYEASGQRDLALLQYEHCVAILREELGVQPSIETLRVAAQLFDVHTPLRTPRPTERRTGIPVPPTRLIGRGLELEQVSDALLHDGVRLLTLVGPGGVGKTRLAIAVAFVLAEQFADGATFVSLATVRDAALVPTAIAQALGLREEPGRSPRDQIVTALRERTMLLLLDNFEQVRAAAPVVADILAACPEITMLVTSREPLHLRAEQLHSVPPLAIPRFRSGALVADRPEVLAASEAVALFLERARAIVPGLPLTPSNAVAIARICARLDGLPLAIELAAARSREFAPEHLLEVLDDRMGTLVDGYQDLPARQQTMRDAIAWSYNLLDADSQRLFRRMAVFTGGCTTEIAVRISGGTVASAEVMLQALVNKSLAHRRSDGSSYVEMLETTRAFALDQLDQGNEAQTTRDLLLAYAVDLTATAADHLAGSNQGAWLDRLDAEHDTVRAALSASVAHHEVDVALALAGNLWRYWWSRGYLSEGRDWLAKALQLTGESQAAVRGVALNGAASLAESQGDFAHAVARHEAALAIWAAERNLSGEARARSGLGTAAAHRGEFALARTHHEHALRLSRQAGDTPGTARTLDRLGTVARHEGNLPAAEIAYGESLQLFREMGDLVNVSIVLSNLGEVLLRHGEAARAAAHFEEALRLERELDLPDGIAFDLTNLARVRLELGELEHAAALIAQGVRLFWEMGNDLGLANALAVQASVCHARGESGRAWQLLGESLDILATLDERAAMPEHLEQLALVAAETDEFAPALRFLAAAQALREQLGAPPMPHDRRIGERVVAAGSHALGADATAAALTQAHSLSLNQILAEATARSATAAKV